jgi:hypothetical protein
MGNERASGERQRPAVAGLREPGAHQETGRGALTRLVGVAAQAGATRQA